MNDVPRVLVVPGLAVRRYAEGAVRCLADCGYDTDLLLAPAWRGTEADVRRYGVALAGQLEDSGLPIDLLVGLSLGSQAAAVTAVSSRHVHRLLLVSPTVDARHRSRHQLIGAWLFGKQKGDPSFRQQVPDWTQAGPVRIFRGLQSSLHVVLEDILPEFSGDVTVVQPEYDTLGSLEYATRVADSCSARLVSKPAAAHSWPVNDAAGFVELVGSILGEPPIPQKQK